MSEVDAQDVIIGNRLLARRWQDHTPTARHDIEETSTLVTLVAAGLGVVIVPAPTSALDIAGVVYRPLQPHSLGIDLVAAWPTSAQD